MTAHKPKKNHPWKCALNPTGKPNNLSDYYMTPMTATEYGAEDRRKNRKGMGPKQRRAFHEMNKEP